MKSNGNEHIRNRQNPCSRTTLHQQLHQILHRLKTTYQTFNQTSIYASNNMGFITYFNLALLTSMTLASAAKPGFHNVGDPCPSKEAFKATGCSIKGNDVLECYPNDLITPGASGTSWQVLNKCEASNTCTCKSSKNCACVS